jgi:hypothetical protein
VKLGDMTAIRLALAYAYGPPPAETGDGTDDEPAFPRAPDLDPRPKTREEELGEIWLEDAQADVDYRMRLRAIGVTDEAFQSMVFPAIGRGFAGFHHVALPNTGSRSWLVRRWT